MNALSLGCHSLDGAPDTGQEENDNARFYCYGETDSAWLLVDGGVCSGVGTFPAGELQERLHRAAGDRRRGQCGGAGVSADAGAAG